MPRAGVGAAAVAAIVGAALPAGRGSSSNAYSRVSSGTVAPGQAVRTFSAIAGSTTGA
jgi:hypothetical protein